MPWPLYHCTTTSVQITTASWIGRLGWRRNYHSSSGDCKEWKHAGYWTLPVARGCTLWLWPNRGTPTVVGADLSAGMIERARANGKAAGVDVRFEVAGFGELSTKVGINFDALLCLGNSLPHLLTPADLRTTLADFAACLRPGGLVLIQNRNFDAVLARRERCMEPQAHREGSREWLFLRFYDFNPDGTLTFNVVTLRRDEAGEWIQQVEATKLRPLLHAELLDAVAAAGFSNAACYGDMTSAPFDSQASPNLVVTAQRGA
jgi:glycine/sarcosine N-methyltransferase